MNTTRSWLLFLFVLACAAAFLNATGDGLPPRVGAHFAASGAADGFAPRDAYMRFILTFTVGFPALVVTLMWFAFTRSRAAFNLPNRDYWLAGDRRRYTVAYLVTRAHGFGCLLTAFLCYVHWLVVNANAVQPPRLDSGRMVTGLVIFFVATLFWLSGVWRRFRRTDDPRASGSRRAW